MSQQTRSRLGKILVKTLKVLGGFAALVAVALVVSHFVWKYSGSTEWKLELDKRGVQVYSLKTPGRTLKDFKAVTRIKTTLNRVVAAMISTETEDCAEWSPSCRSVRSIQTWDPAQMNYIHLYRLDYGGPFETREFLLKAQVSQDPQTKTVTVEFTARPDELPRDGCCVRVEHMHNLWRFTPLENGEVEVEIRTNMDPGIPYFLVNRVSPAFFYQMFRPLEKWYNREKWQQARFDRIKEM